MKKQVLILILSITASLFSLTSCGNTAGAEESINTEVKESVVYTPDPTPTATPESTPTPTPTPTPTATPTPTPTPDPTASPDNGYSLDEESKAFLKQMGATDEELNNVKSDKDLDNLINNLSSRLYGNGGGSSTTGGGSSSADTGSGGATGDEVHDPSRVPELPQGTVGGYM